MTYRQWTTLKALLTLYTSLVLAAIGGASLLGYFIMFVVLAVSAEVVEFIAKWGAKHGDER